MYSIHSSTSQSSENDFSDEDTDITDLHMQQLESLLPRVRKTLTDYELRLKTACRQLLQKSTGVISMLSLIETIDRDAADFLVDECLLLFTDDLFEAHSALDPAGYIKYVSDKVDLTFIDRLLRYKLDPLQYFQDINIPEVWKSYLSNNGKSILRTMAFYKKILDAKSSTELINNIDIRNSVKSYHNNSYSSTLSNRACAENSHRCKCFLILLSTNLTDLNADKSFNYFFKLMFCPHTIWVSFCGLTSFFL